ncbi:MAG: SpoIIE family protein phosphatase [Acidobacteriota bacterium]
MGQRRSTRASSPGRSAKSPDPRGFFRRYTEGLRRRDLERLWSKDAPRAFDILTREHRAEAMGQEKRDPGKRWFGRARLIFLGLSYRLSPARRAVFAFSVLCALLGLLNLNWVVGTATHGMRISVQASPFLFTLAFGSLLFLFAVEMVDRVLVRDELQVAHELQGDLMPKAAPSVPGWSFAHAWRTANGLGGDYYAFLPAGEHRLAVIIGDASGHGMAAALLMAIANATLQTAVETDPTPIRAVELLHRILLRTGDRRAFMALFYGLLDTESGEFEYICAGQPFPLLRRRGGEIEELGSGALPLGMSPTLKLTPGRTVINPGDLLVLYTDGLPEGLDADGAEAFGFEHLNTLLLAGGSAETAHSRIWLDFRRHAGEAGLEDDVTMVVLERQPVNVPQPPLPEPPSPPAT